MAGDLNRVSETLANSMQLQPEPSPTPMPAPTPTPTPAPTPTPHSIAYRSLVSAVANNNLQQVLEALQHGADVNEPLNFGEIPILTFSIGGGDVEIVKTLLAAGADVNRTTRCNDTALCCAIAECYPEIVKVLLKAGADINIVTADDLTPLSLASRMRNVEIVKMLIEAGANVNATDGNGNTALFEACEKDETEIAEVLLEAGADVNAKNNKGQIVLDVAYSKKTENFLIIYHIVQALWDIWELESAIYSSYLQWLPRKMLEDVIAVLHTKSSRQQSQLSLENSQPSFFSNRSGQREESAVNHSSEQAQQVSGWATYLKCILQ